MPMLFELPVRIDVEFALFKTLNDVRLSSAQLPWLSVTSVQRVIVPAGRAVVAACAVTWPHEA